VSHSVNNSTCYRISRESVGVAHQHVAACVHWLRSYRAPQIRCHGRNNTEGTARET